MESKLKQQAADIEKLENDTIAPLKKDIEAKGTLIE